ncbi:hypothetical protein THASP1DRAFT_26106 [Thamnocephalis sphaerospora]|uniref:Uncharacterized protein n=1 Tax=Thamnocephalis sphaerospora TaxID=78915 RepID=A0A4P9XI84_9FUNG|nr:hypothetical protein THASP1DRAFT_26106 [Thamnocephalis sphaerospora]|eukprot:RKP05387.1 hypothetical protein THASP1DRAFT_26106 [Thamnocephalis sphaerospora]
MLSGRSAAMWRQKWKPHAISAALVGLTFVGSLTSALPPRIEVSQVDPAVLEVHSTGPFQLIPHFAILQPENTYSIYYKDRHNHVSSIEFSADDGRIIRSVSALPSASSGRNQVMEVVDYLPNGSINNATMIDLAYSDDNSKVNVYTITTSTRKIFATTFQNGSGLDDAFVVLQPGGRSFTLKDMQRWDGLDIPLVQGPRNVYA